MAAIKHLLFVEDEPALAEIVKESLMMKGYMVSHCKTGQEAMNIYASKDVDLIILDVMLPDTTGFELAKQLRQTDSQTPIIFLTAKSQTIDVVTGFESGANDYVKKPFSLEELAVRIKVLLSSGRQLEVSSTTKLATIGKYEFIYPKAILSLNGQIRKLTSREAEILQLLLLNKHHILSRDTILDQLWQNNDYFSGRSLDVFITKLRKYLKNDPSIGIINVRGQGYKLMC
ncbi:response regulator transcription factor [Pedobacter sp.]|uniref:response regulator transcription factor n=1 Tax=Pedobacter sp. TaxID=1411316 RepID=UPI0031D5AC09